MEKILTEPRPKFTPRFKLGPTSPANVCSKYGLHHTVSQDIKPIKFKHSWSLRQDQRSKQCMFPPEEVLDVVSRDGVCAALDFQL